MYEGLSLWSINLCLCLAFDPMVYSVTGATMLDWWSLWTNIISSVGHLGSDLVGLLVMDSTLQHPR
jgi:hypothetical protein